MKIQRHGAVLGLVAASALLLGACGSDNNAPTGGNNTQANATSMVECGGKAKLKASGSSAQANAMTRFVTAYENQCDGQSLDYNSNGSGAGVKEFNGKQTDIGGSDSSLNKDKGEYDAAKTRCDGSDAWNLPAVFGPIAMTYNVEGADGLVLDAPLIAKIFSGAVATWNDPAIAALNSGKQLPGDKIVVIFRSDESGTTDNFQKYLEAASGGTWTKGSGKAFAGGVGEGAKGNEGTSAAVKSTKGAITYNEWSFAKSNKLQIAKIINAGGGEPVELTAETAGKAIDGAKIKGEGNDLVLDLNSLYATKTAGAYPLVLAAYEIVCSKYTDAETAKAVKAFLTVAVTDGQKGLEEAGYIPVPKAFQDKLLTAIKAIA
ncbi:phosphate ABC transporter substrate-binding protein, PhoT family [Lentzea albidocapillata subsp. violacea]|uniref:Phosphate-binding protein n=1 Tax=Lentzea albidocapillata subsp. violacea TaxID=128104 RepID=A0A1G9LNS9_9PSEU|nr:phosphate ABC transporter substrate-binding protein PstS [Lentzea albidocapillata]SDL63523.1 phosphate ABC transporter substrate-binding protein, PhoT family [Lentzea albidocapillata subsp. violacea]